MAKKNNIDTNIPLSYRELQKANAEAYTSAESESPLAKITKAGVRLDPMAFVYEGPEHSPLQQQGNGDYWGNSMWDNPTVTPEEWDDAGSFGDTRAENQWLIAKWGSALGNAATLAGTTFLDGTLGLLFGIGTAIGEQRWSGLWDNAVSNGLQEINRKIQNEILPYYKTRQSQDTPWYEQLGSVDFWADGFLKNLGFTVGAMYSGGVFTKVLKGMKLLSNANTLGAQLAGSIYSAVNEGRIEANQNAYDDVVGKMKIIDQSKQETIAAINSNKDLSSTQKMYAIQQMNQRYDAEVQNIQEEARKMGNLDLLLNIPILALDNFWTFGKFYTKGFDTARRNMKGGVSKKANKLFSEANNPLRRVEQATGNTGEYVWKDITNGESVRKGLMTALREGNEELAQAMAAEVASNLNSDTPDSYYKAISDPNAKREALSTEDSIIKAFADTYGNKDRYEEFAIGALTGLLGTPTFGRVQNADANTYIGRGKPIGISGGIFGEWKSAQEINKRGREAVGHMNKLKAKIDNSTQNLMQRKAFTDAMDGWVAADDKFEYKNQEDNDMWRGINAFLSTGRRDDLMQLISTDSNSFSREELENIAKITSPEDYGVNAEFFGGQKNTSGWRDANGNYLTDTDEGTQSMKEALIKKQKAMKEDIDRYDRALHTVRSISNNNVNQSEDEISELAWLLWKADKFKARVQDIKDEQGGKMNLLDELLSAYSDAQQKILDGKDISTEGLSPEAALAMDVLKSKIIGNKKVAAENLNDIQHIRNILHAVQQAEEDTMPMVNWLLKGNTDLLDSLAGDETFKEAVLKGQMNNTDFETLITSLRDLGRLSKAYNEFQKRFDEFSKDPLKQKKNRQKIDNERKKEDEAAEKAEARTKAKNTTRQQYRNMTEEEKADFVSSLKDSDKDAKDMVADEDERANRAEAILAEAQKRQNADLLSEEAENALFAAVQAAEDSASLGDPTSEVFLVKADGNPLEEEDSAAIQDIVKTAMSNMKNTKSMAVPSTEDSTAKSDSTKSTSPSSSTGHDAVDRIERTSISGESPKEEKKEGEEEKTDKNAALKQKYTNTLITYSVNMNPGMTPEEQAEVEKRSKEVIDDIVGHLDEGLSSSQVQNVLKKDDSYQKLQALLQQAPLTATIIQSMEKELKPEAFAEEKKEEEKKKKEEDKHISVKEVGDDAPVSESSSTASPIFQSEPVIAQAWRPNMDQFYNDRTGKQQTVGDMPFHKTAEAKKLYTKAQLAAMEVVYNYLQDHHAFENASRVKKGDKVYFAADPALVKELREKTGDKNAFVILMSSSADGKTIIGSQVIGLPSAPFQSFKNYQVAEQYHREYREYDAWLKTNPEAGSMFISKEQSYVQQVMLGHVKYTDSKAKKTDKTLNDLFEAKGLETDPGFKLAVTAEGELSTGVHTTAERIISPRNLTRGLPYILIPSGEGYGRYVAIPFQMNRYDSEVAQQPIGKFIREQLLRELNGVDIKTTKGQIALRTALERVFGHQFLTHYDEKTKQLIVSKITGTDSNEMFFGRTIPEDATVENIVDNILKAMQNKKSFAIRVNKNLINTQVSLDGKTVSYNALIGATAHSNIAVPHTVNDWFTVAPLDNNGQTEKTKNLKYKKKESVSNFVEYNGHNYRIDGTAIRDEQDKEITDLSDEQRNIILAINEVRNSKHKSPISPKATSWYRLNNGALFNDDPNSFDYITDEKEIEKKIAELTAEPKNGKMSKDDLDDAVSNGSSIWSTKVSSTKTEDDVDLSNESRANELLQRIGYLKEGNQITGFIESDDSKSAHELSELQQKYVRARLRSVFANPSSNTQSVHDAVRSTTQHIAAPMTVLDMLYAVNQAVKDGKLSVDEAMEIVEAHMNKPIQPKTATSMQQQIFDQEVEHLQKMGITVHNKAEMDAFLKEHGYDDIQEFIEAYGKDNPYHNKDKASEEELQEIYEQIKNNKYSFSGTDILRLENEKSASKVFLVDHSADNELAENRRTGDGFGIRKVYEIKELTQDDIKEIIRNVGANNKYSERSILHKLQNMGITAEQLRGIDIAAELKVAISSNNSVGFRNGKARNQSRDNRSGAESRGNTRVLSEENGRDEIQELRISRSQEGKPSDIKERISISSSLLGDGHHLVFGNPETASSLSRQTLDSRREAQKNPKHAVFYVDKYEGYQHLCYTSPFADRGGALDMVFWRHLTEQEKQKVQDVFLSLIRKGWDDSSMSNLATEIDKVLNRNEQGELYGFVYNGEIYLDETKMSPNAAMHEYTHLWDNTLMDAAAREPNSDLGKLWARGKELMKQTSLWRQIAEDENYGKKWEKESKSGSYLEDLIASEVHSRLVGENGEKLLNEQAKEKGAEGIIGKLKQWITDVWKALGKTFGTWTDEELDKLTLDDFVHMTVRDFVEGINPNKVEINSYAVNEESKQTELQSKYPKGLDSLEATRQIWDKFTPEQKQKYEQLSEYAKQTLLPEELNTLYKRKNKKIDKIKTSDIDNILDDLHDAKYRKTEKRRTESFDIQKELSWVKQALPQLSDEEHLRIVRGLIKIANSQNAQQAWGMYTHGMIMLSDGAARGTVYHEAFHSVIDNLLSQEERKQLFREGSKKYSQEIESKEDLLNIEEKLAEDFRNYMQNEEGFKGFFIRAFRTMKHIVQNWIGNEPYFNNLFYRISRGRLADTEISNNSDEILNAIEGTTEQTKYRMSAMQKQNVVDYYFKNIHKKNLSDYDVARINDDLEEMAMRAGDSVAWHLQPTKYGGYYIAGYRNQSVTMDGYWSPGLNRRYRTTEEKGNEVITMQDITNHYKRKFEYQNLTGEQQQFLEDRGINEKEYKDLTTSEKEGLFRCML